MRSGREDRFRGGVPGGDADPGARLLLPRNRAAENRTGRVQVRVDGRPRRGRSAACDRRWRRRPWQAVARRSTPGRSGRDRLSGTPIRGRSKTVSRVAPNESSSRPPLANPPEASTTDAGGMRHRAGGVGHVEPPRCVRCPLRAPTARTPEHDARTASPECVGQRVEEADAGYRRWQCRDLEYLSIQPLLELLPCLLGSAQAEHRRHADALVRVELDARARRPASRSGFRCRTVRRGRGR